MLEIFTIIIIPTSFIQLMCNCSSTRFPMSLHFLRRLLAVPLSLPVPHPDRHESRVPDRHAGRSAAGAARLPEVRPPFTAHRHALDRMMGSFTHSPPPLPIEDIVFTFAQEISSQLLPNGRGTWETVGSPTQ